MTEVMTYRGHVRALSKLGLPLIGGNLAQFAVTMTDTLMLGWYSVAALAAVTLGGMYFFEFFILGSGFAIAVMPLVARAVGENDDQTIRRVTRMGLWLSLAYALVCLPVFWFSDAILRSVGQDPELSLAAQGYLRLVWIGLGPAMLVMVLKSYLAALERTKVVFWVTVAAAVANALANYALIFGNWGAPELGITGAALASILVQVVSLVGISGYVLVVLPEHQIFVRLWRPDWDVMGRVFRLGWPIGLTNLAESGLFAASAVMMGWLGTIPLAAHGIALNLASATFMLHLGLSSAATVRAGNAIGRRDGAHLMRGGIVAIVMSMAAAMLAVTLFVTLPEPLVGFFLSETDPDRAAIIEVGVVLLAMAALFQFFDGAQVMALGLLRGVQDSRAPMVIATIS
jgi:MATE family multidrug resistance protein